MPSNAEQKVLDQIVPSRVWRDLELLCSLDRTSGTDGEAKAMAYIADSLKATGVEVELHSFDAYLSYPISGDVTVIAGEGLPPGFAAKTRAFSGNTPPDGLAAEVIYVPGGHDLFRDTETHRRLDDAGIAGKIVLSEAGSRRNMQAAQEKGAVAYIHAWPSDEDALHEGIVSPIWGSPTPESAAFFPRIPILSIARRSAEAVRAALEHGPVTLRLHSRTDTGWRRVTLPVAVIPGRTPEFVLFSGHVDSWFLGATDNATGNAVAMEIVRVLHANRDGLRRGVRCAFWPGHSTGRYAGSTWYADQEWQRLHDDCVLHINCDSPGVLGATDYSPVTASAEVAEFGVALVGELTGQAVAWERPVRAGDQSFWGAGVPSLFMGLSVRPEGQRAAVGGSGFGWWWHTEADTIDKVDAGVLERDMQIYLLATHRFATAAVPPLKVADAVAEMQEVVTALDREVVGRFDLSPVGAALTRLHAAAVAFDAAVGDVTTGAAEGADASARVAAACRAQRGAVRELVRMGYTEGDPFEHDRAVPQLPLPSLQEVRDLARRDPEAQEARLLSTRLLRRRNMVVAGIQTATGALEAGLLALRQ